MSVQCSDATQLWCSMNRPLHYAIMKGELHTNTKKKKKSVYHGNRCCHASCHALWDTALGKTKRFLCRIPYGICRKGLSILKLQKFKNCIKIPVYPSVLQFWIIFYTLWSINRGLLGLMKWLCHCGFFKQLTSRSSFKCWFF